MKTVNRGPRTVGLLIAVMFMAACNTAIQSADERLEPLNTAAVQAPATSKIQLVAVTAPAAIDGGTNTSDAIVSAATDERAEAPYLTVPELVRLISPAVVHISTRQFAVDALGRPVPEGGAGTGFLIDAAGHVVTNNHVVADSERILVTSLDGRTVETVLVGRDPQTDIAVIRINTRNATVTELGSSSDLQVGEQVVAIGHALDLPGGPTVTVGVVSALDRILTNVDGAGQTFSELIQTDASINPGSSGGPLMNMAGKVVGMNTAGIPGSQNVGFAISIDSAKPLINELIAEGRIERGYLGIVTATVTRTIAEQNGFPVDHGVFILQVSPRTGASSAGLRHADIIIELAGDEVSDSGDLSRILGRHKPGSTVEVKFHRSVESGVRTVPVTLGTRPDA